VLRKSKNCFLSKKRALFKPLSDEKHVHAQDIAKLPVVQLGGKRVNTQEIVKFPLLQLGAKHVNMQEIAKFPLLQVGEKRVNIQKNCEISIFVPR